jgi:uncharacterized phage protein (TIGR01671 family)
VRVRDIKFRGKRIDNGEWVYGLPCRSPANIVGVNTILCDDWYDNDFGMICGHIETIDPATLGQYTGLHDKNGKEIYEGDVIKWGDSIAPIKYEAPTFYYADADTLMNSTVLNPHSKKYFEIIGNIHDTAEIPQPCSPV